MNLVCVNSCNFGSTGKIMCDIAQTAKAHNYNVVMSYPESRGNVKNSKNDDLYIVDRFTRNYHLIFAELCGLDGCFSYSKTKSFLKKVSEYSPDLIHLHNIHGSYINIPLLFNFIKEHNISVVWTLHDCWSFTGHCPHFDMAGCDKWKSGCGNCPQYHEYPKSLFDNSKYMFKLKKKWFGGVENMTIVTPSQWLAGLVGQSFLQGYPIKVINNGIDLEVFKPSPSDFRQKYGIGDKHIVLGVAFDWGKRKGLDVFAELAKRLDGAKYQIVLVGTSDKIDKQLPDGIISIHRTHDQNELAEIYTAADVFVNPTYEDNYPTVNLEAQACGTPGVTFNSGGSPECYDSTCGSVVAKDDIGAMECEIIRICETKPYSAEACMRHAKLFDKNDRFQEYIDLYEVLAK